MKSRGDSRCRRKKARSNSQLQYALLFTGRFIGKAYIYLRGSCWNRVASDTGRIYRFLRRRDRLNDDGQMCG